MKPFLLIFLLAISTSLQAQHKTKNGIIYKEHPYIEKVIHLFALGGMGDTLNMCEYYADTVKFYSSPNYFQDPNYQNLNEARLNWIKLYRDWDNISITKISDPEGYDYLHELFKVKSIWKISALFKKTQKKASFIELVIDEFNNAGKIIRETSYFDSNSIKEAVER